MSPIAIVERMRRLMTLWNWLPGFRAVAETQHLPDASEQLHVSASALSRTIRLLEDDLGQPLFNRVGRNLELNAKGQMLLSAVRDSMRSLDDVLSRIAEEQFDGGLTISCAPAFAARFLIAPLARLKSDYPRLIPTLTAVDSEHVASALLRGSLDVAFLLDPRANDELEIVKLAELSFGLYAGRGHALHGSAASLEEALAHELVADDPEAFVAGVVPRLGARGGLSEALMWCAAGTFLAVLPDEIVEPRLQLTRVCAAPMKPSALYAQQRRSLGARRPADVLIDAVRSEAARRQTS